MSEIKVRRYELMSQMLDLPLGSDDEVLTLRNKAEEAEIQKELAELRGLLEEATCKSGLQKGPMLTEAVLCGDWPSRVPRP